MFFQGRLIFMGIWKTISSEAQELVRAMLRVNTAERIPVKSALEHSWFNDSIVSYAKQVVRNYEVSNFIFASFIVLTTLKFFAKQNFNNEYPKSKVFWSE